MKGIIYRAVNRNTGKKYFGQTVQSLKKMRISRKKRCYVEPPSDS